MFNLNITTQDLLQIATAAGKNAALSLLASTLLEGRVGEDGTELVNVEGFGPLFAASPETAAFCDKLLASLPPEVLATNTNEAHSNERKLYELNGFFGRGSGLCSPSQLPPRLPPPPPRIPRSKLQQFQFLQNTSTIKTMHGPIIPAGGSSLLKHTPQQLHQLQQLQQYQPLVQIPSRSSQSHLQAKHKIRTSPGTSRNAMAPIHQQQTRPLLPFDIQQQQKKRFAQMRTNNLKDPNSILVQQNNSQQKGVWPTTIQVIIPPCDRLPGLEFHRPKLSPSRRNSTASSCSIDSNSTCGSFPHQQEESAVRDKHTHNFVRRSNNATDQNYDKGQGQSASTQRHQSTTPLKAADNLANQTNFALNSNSCSLNEQLIALNDDNSKHCMTTIITQSSAQNQPRNNEQMQKSVKQNQQKIYSKDKSHHGQKNQRKPGPIKFGLRLTNYWAREPVQPNTDEITKDEFARCLNLVRRNEFEKTQKEITDKQASLRPAMLTARPLRMRRTPGKKTHSKE